MQIEFHFQEGFTGQMFSLWSGNQKLAGFTAQTQLMTGMAKIIPLELHNGEEVLLRAEDEPAQIWPVIIDAATPFVTVTRKDSTIRIEQVSRRPGYL